MYEDDELVSVLLRKYKMIPICNSSRAPVLQRTALEKRKPEAFLEKPETENMFRLAFFNVHVRLQ